MIINGLDRETFANHGKIYTILASTKSEKLIAQVSLDGKLISRPRYFSKYILSSPYMKLVTDNFKSLYIKVPAKQHVPNLEYKASDF